MSSPGAPQGREASTEGRGKDQQRELGCCLLVGKDSEAVRGDTGAWLRDQMSNLERQETSVGK